MIDVDDPLPPYPQHREATFDPPPELARWQATSPVNGVRLWNGDAAWLVTGLEEARAVLGDHDRFSARPTAPGYPTLSAADAASKESGLLLFTDPPEHTTLRRAVQREFTVKRIEAWRGQIEQLVDGLLSKMAELGPPVDLVSAFAAPAPAQLTCRLLGVPVDDAELFARCLSQRFDPAAGRDSVIAADQQLADYFRRVVRDRAASPGDDLSGRLVADHVATGALTRGQASSLLHVLLIGGFDTTRNMISMGTVLLADRPAELAALGTDRARWIVAIEELLRYLSIVQYRRRAVTEDAEVGGHLLRAGEGVIVALHAANRNADAFPHPDALDLARDDNSHIAFGSGIHQCLGQPVARVTLQAALPRLFSRFPGLRLAVPAEEVVFNEHHNIWGPGHLPVTW